MCPGDGLLTIQFSFYAIRGARFDIAWLDDETVEAVSHAEILCGAVQRVDDLIVPEI
jgi:hypothetical protein